MSLGILIAHDNFTITTIAIIICFEASSPDLWARFRRKVLRYWRHDIWN
jgi:hypothetical protein